MTDRLDPFACARDTANDHQAPATAEQWARVDFEPFEAAFSREAWENVVPEAYKALALAKKFLGKSKDELVDVVRRLSNDDGQEALVECIEVMAGVREVFGKYSGLLQAAETRLIVASTVIELNG